MFKSISLITVAWLTLAGASIISTSKSLAHEIPKAQCLSAYGQTKCGYSCLAAYGEIRCANWAGGACGAAYGEIKCGPEAPPNWLDFYRNRQPAHPSYSRVQTFPQRNPVRQKSVVCSGNQFMDWFYITRISDSQQLGERISLKVCQASVNASNSDIVCTGDEFMNWFYITRISDGKKFGDNLPLAICLQVSSGRN